MHQQGARQALHILEPLDTELPQPEIRFAEMTVSLVEDVSTLEAEWRRLERFSRNSPHQSLEWCRAWCHAHGRRLVALQGMATGQVRLLIPLEIVVEHGIRVARLPGGRFNNINTLLLDPALATPDAEELQKFKAELSRTLRDKADLVVLDNVPLSWRGVDHPLAALASIENQNHSFQLPLFANFEATLAQLNAKSRRKKFRLQVRRLEALGGFEHVVAGEDERHAMLDLFFRQKGERLALFGLPDVFQPAEIRQFFHRLLEVPVRGSNAPLSLHAIRLLGAHAGHVAAIAGLARRGDHVICLFSSIDDSIAADASPGELLFWLMIEQCCHEGVAIFDFGIGDQPYKRSWCSQETIQHDLLIPVSWKGMLARPVLIAATKAKKAVKNNPRLYALAQRLRSGRLTG